MRDYRCPDCGRETCTGEGCYWPDEAGIERPASRRLPSGPDAPGQAPNPFGGHEFHYEGHTDLFRCIRCHRYEVTVRSEDGTIEPCAGTAPAGSGPIEVNAW